MGGGGFFKYFTRARCSSSFQVFARGEVFLLSRNIHISHSIVSNAVLLLLLRSVESYRVYSRLISRDQTLRLITRLNVNRTYSGFQCRGGNHYLGW